MILLSDIDLSSARQCTAKFEVLRKDGTLLMFHELISLPRAVKEQVANHMERIKVETGSKNIRFVGIY